MDTVSVIVAAGGSGRRLRAGRPKALVALAGRPMLFHSLEVFAGLRFVREVVLVLPPAWVDRTVREWSARLRKLKVAKVVPGGARRQDSVYNGLAVTEPSSRVVLVHDAARPFVSAELVGEIVRAAARHGAAVPVVPVIDTVKVVDARGRVVETPDRERLRAAQTPQGFRREVLLAAYRTSGEADATDDVQLVERAGGTVIAVESDSGNFKVTTPEDLARAEARLRRRR